MSSKKFLIAAAILVAGTSATLAQGFGHFGGPQPNYGPGYGYSQYTGPGYYENNTQRGGPGPRVQSGSGMGVGAER